MTTTIMATYDGQVLRPEEPLEIPANTRVQLTIATPPPARSFLDVAQSLNLNGPPDWSERFDEYLYGRDGASLEEE